MEAWKQADRQASMRARKKGTLEIPTKCQYWLANVLFIAAEVDNGISKVL